MTLGQGNRRFAAGDQGDGGLGFIADRFGLTGEALAQGTAFTLKVFAHDGRVSPFAGFLSGGSESQLVGAEQNVGYAGAGFLECFRDAFCGSVFQVAPDAVRNVA